MRFAPHWARVSLGEDGQPDPAGPYVGFGWSLGDPAEARAMATRRALGVRAWVEDPEGRADPEGDYYPTDGSVLREVVLEEGGAGAVRWAVTRNRYGAEVLNVDGMAILDVDVPARRVVVEPTGFFGRLFGRPTVRWERDDPAEVLARLRATLDGCGLGGRVYETAAGFRVLVTSEVLSWDAPRFRELLEATGSDPLYATLCRRQECCRARLTPKPWRLGFRGPDTGTVPTPWAPDPVPAWREWLVRYRERSAGRSTARHLADFGPTGVVPELVDVVARHDRCVGDGELA
jgi:hypothetical protein